jgi:hypothetical protein
LSELLGGVEGEPLQVELRAMRILFELLGFLLSAAFLEGQRLKHGGRGVQRVKLRRFRF